MADNGGRLDLTPYIRDFRPSRPADEILDEMVQGVKSAGPITITGRWLGANDRICVVCGSIFAVSPDQPHGVITVDGQPAGDACDRCAMGVC
jgi:hypothetical protein